MKPSENVAAGAPISKFTFGINPPAPVEIVPKFGEYLFDYKMSQFRPIKILRTILRFPFYFIFFLLTLQFLKSYIKLSEFFGAIKFIYFYLSNRKIKKLHV